MASRALCVTPIFMKKVHEIDSKLFASVPFSAALFYFHTRKSDKNKIIGLLQDQRKSFSTEERWFWNEFFIDEVKNREYVRTMLWRHYTKCAFTSNVRRVLCACQYYDKTHFVLMFWKWLVLPEEWRIYRIFQILFKILWNSQVGLNLWDYIYISRNFNRAVHQLAKFSFDYNEHFEWFRNFSA